MCWLVESCIPKQLRQYFEDYSVGLYRDNDLALLKGLSGPQTERVKVIKVFKNCGLNPLMHNVPNWSDAL